MKKELYDRLVERRADVRRMMSDALAGNNMAKYHRLNGQLQRLNGKIRKDKK